MPANHSGDIAVIGAGVAGMTAAYVLAQAGFHPFILEATGIGAGMTGKSTAHISAAVDGGWRKMAVRLGKDDAALLARGYRHGIDKISEVAAALPDRADFAWVDGELLAKPSDHQTLVDEKDAARAAGLEVKDIQPASAARGLLSLRFPRQGQLHPLKYVGGIAQRLTAEGVPIYKAVVKGFGETAQGVKLQLDNDHIVLCRAAVLAHNLALDAHYPHVKISRRRSYVIAADYRSGEGEDTITWDLAHPYHYTRTTFEDGGRLLLVGGADHSADKHTAPEDRFSSLERWMRERFPTAGEVRYRWWGDLKQTSDSLALLGVLPNFRNIYVIDGDTGLGINHAMLGAEVIKDHMLGRPNPLAVLFAPTRN